MDLSYMEYVYFTVSFLFFFFEISSCPDIFFVINAFCLWSMCISLYLFFSFLFWKYLLVLIFYCKQCILFMLVPTHPLLWLRVDPEMSMLRQVTLEQPDFMWQYMLKYERDVVSQSEVTNIFYFAQCGKFSPIRVVNYFHCGGRLISICILS